MAFYPLAAVPPLAQQVTLGPAGFTLVNGTPNIMSWTAPGTPGDGNEHRVLLFAGVRVTSAQTGGQVNASFTDPAGNAAVKAVIPGSNAAGFIEPNAGGTVFPVQSGSVFTILQGNVQSAGAAVLFC